MLQLGIQGKRRRRRARTTWRALGVAPAPDLVQRNFKANAPDQIYVGDIKYVWTGEGFLYLAGVIDVFTHAPVGWAMANTLHTDLVLDALKMALWRRRPAAGAIHHSDQGTQYTSLTFGRTLREAGILGSMGRRGDAYDNAMAESFWSTIDRELLADSNFIDRASARMAIFEYIECWFVPWRRHSSLGMLSPAEFERQWRANQLAEEVLA